MKPLLGILAVCVLGLGFALPLFAADRIALVIGNADYAKGSVFPDLRLAGKDAKLVADTLEDLGFEVIFVQDATKAVIYNRLLDFEERIEEGGTALFYFSGHGIEFEKKNYLTGTNAIFRDRDLIGEETLNADIVVSKMQGANPRTAMVFLDCCRETPPDSWILSGNRTKGASSSGLAPMSTSPGLVIGFAASAGNLANDSLGGTNGPFATALTKYMGTGAEISDVLKLTGREVNRLSHELKAKLPDERGLVIQEPAFYGQIYHDFYFSPDGKPAVGNEQAKKITALEEQVTAMKKIIEDLEKAGTENEALKEQLAKMEQALDEEKSDKPAEVKVMAVTQPEQKPAFPATRGMEGSKAGETRTFGGIEFVWCPPTGEEGFLMGSPEDEEGRIDDEKQHRVILTKGFWMAKTECTQGQWESVIGNNPSYFKGTKDLPVEQVSWNDVQGWMARMNNEHPLPEGWSWKLPTEAQWEYACRAGTRTVFAFGNSLGIDQAHFDGYPYGGGAKGEFLAKTFEVGRFVPNSWGLLDMHGNVYEWCADWYDRNYYSDGQRDPSGPSQGTSRLMRGGSWDWSATMCRSAGRLSFKPETRLNGVGFRPAISPTQ